MKRIIEWSYRKRGVGLVESLKNSVLVLLLLGIFSVINNSAVGQQIDKNNESSHIKALGTSYYSTPLQNLDVLKLSRDNDISFTESQGKKISLINLLSIGYPNLGLKTTRRLLKMKYVSFIVNFRKVNYIA